jgi:hypothetical protein
MTNPVSHPYFQVGVLVEDIDAARAELGAALGLDWTDVITREIGEWSLQVCFAKQGPPYLELIEGPAGSPWEITDGPRIDHIGYWTDDLAETKQRLESAGLPMEFDGPKHGGVFTYHRGPKSGLRVELIDGDTRSLFYERWGFKPPDKS